MNILVTGGTGFIGSHVVRRLVASGRSVCVAVRPTSDRSRLAETAQTVRWVTADLTNPEEVNAMIRTVKPQVVFHLAGSAFNPPNTPAAVHGQLNVMGTLHLLEALRTICPTARLICAGSAAEYGAGSQLTEEGVAQPRNVFGLTKLAATHLIQGYARVYGLRTVVLRIFTPFGPYEHRERLIPHTIHSALQGREVALSDGRQQRDFLYVEDLVDLMLLAAEREPPPGTVLNASSGTGVAVRTIVGDVLDLMGRPVNMKVGVLPTRPDEIWECSGSNEKARTLLGWTPRHSLRDGLQLAIRWWREHEDAALVR